ADAVGRDLQQVLEERDAPGHERGDPPRLRAEVLQVPVPREGHEQVGRRQQECRQHDGICIHSASGKPAAKKGALYRLGRPRLSSAASAPGSSHQENPMHTRNSVFRPLAWLAVLVALALAGCSSPPSAAGRGQAPKNIIILFADGAAPTQWDFGRYSSTVL